MNLAETAAAGNRISKVPYQKQKVIFWKKPFIIPVERVSL